MRFGYVMVIVSFLLMVWVSLSGAKQGDFHINPPCIFNPLCTCSKNYPDLGTVRCINIDLPRIPETVNSSKVFTLHLGNNGLRFIEPYFFLNTGLYKLSIRSNLLTFIPDESFLGLERSLWELDLAHNQLTTVPVRAIKYLRKLKFIDLTGNDISSLAADNWRGLEASLETLILADNSIMHLPSDAFTGLPKVETIDLSGNHLREIDPTVFRDGMDKLANLLLSDNQLSSIPYQAVAPLKQLKQLDLSYNLITRIRPNASEDKTQLLNAKLNLDVFRLDYNLITELVSESYLNFNVVNKTILDGNLLGFVEEGAFKSAKIKELYMRSCGLTEISPAAFEGIENTLELLDLSENDIKGLANGQFRSLELLRTLSLRGNFLMGFDPKEIFNGIQFTLFNLDLSGTTNAGVAIQDLRRLRNLRHLALSKLSDAELSDTDFAEFGTDVETIKINHAGLKTIKNNCFKNIRGIRKLDLSENNIDTIEPNAFSDIRHTLSSLQLSNALASSCDKFPSDAFRTLSYLESLDFSYNRIKTVPETSFHFLKRLKTLELQDNIIDQIQKGTFQGAIHSNLESIYLSFNNLRTLIQHTFVDLESLDQLHLDDNKIEKIETRAFMNLETLKRLNLKGNRLSAVALEAFQNLPQLEDLDMSYNKFRTFEFSVFDQVGTLSYMFSVNVSHNKITQLKASSDAAFGIGISHSNIKILDISYNNISAISKQFFRPAERSLMRLHISHNDLYRATYDVLGGIVNLRWLDISHNKLLEFEENLFRKSRELQILDASHNLLGEVPSDLFRYLRKLRIVDLSHNHINMLLDNIFREEGLESLDISHNSLMRIPLTSLSVAAASTLCKLDMSRNYISTVTNGELFSRFKSLNYLDLSHNKITQIDTGVFSGLSRLSVLDLGHNSDLELGRDGPIFKGIEDTLLFLNLENISLTAVPDLPLPNLVHLSLAFNYLPTIPPDMATTLSSLRKLNLGYNDLTIVPLVFESFTHLTSLSLVNNNLINVLNNESFAGIADQLEELDIRNLDLRTLQEDTFFNMNALRTLKIGIYNTAVKYNIPVLISGNNGLKHLEIYSEKETNLGDEMNGDFPPKLCNITLSGKGLKSLNSYILRGIQTPNLYLTLRDTAISRVFSDIFRNSGRARNISVDVRANELQHLENPSTGGQPGVAHKTFLKEVLMSGNPWSCDCDLGWVEVWQRKKRQYICESSPSVFQPSTAKDYTCRHPEDDLRNSLCVNKANTSLIEVLKTDLECGWSSAFTSYNNFSLKLTVSCFIMFLSYYFVDL